MIYVEEKQSSRQIELLTHVSKLHDLNICSWLYPECKLDTVAGFGVPEQQLDLQPVTLYEGGVKPMHTELVRASEENIAAFAQASDEVKANCEQPCSLRERREFVVGGSYRARGYVSGSR